MGSAICSRWTVFVVGPSAEKRVTHLGLLSGQSRCETWQLCIQGFGEALCEQLETRTVRNLLIGDADYLDAHAFQCERPVVIGLRSPAAVVHHFTLAFHDDHGVIGRLLPHYVTVRLFQSANVPGAVIELDFKVVFKPAEPKTSYPSRRSDKDGGFRLEGEATFPVTYRIALASWFRPRIPFPALRM